MCPTDPGAQGATCLRVLIIEDHPDCREALRAMLTHLGHRVEVAADGRRGLIQAFTQTPDVAVVGLSLPGPDGYQVAAGLRAALGHYVFLIAHSSFGGPEDLSRAREAGFDAFLLKPARLDQLAALLHEVMALHASRQPPAAPAPGRPRREGPGPGGLTPRRGPPAALAAEPGPRA